MRRLRSDLGRLGSNWANWDQDQTGIELGSNWDQTGAAGDFTFAALRIDPLSLTSEMR